MSSSASSAASQAAQSAMPRIFISHSHLDNVLGLRLVADLRARLGDEAVWYDSSGGLRGGEEWWNTIVAEITARDTFIVILSPAALASDWVPREMGIAYLQHVKLGKHLLPLVYQPCTLSPDWELIHSLRMSNPTDDPAAYAAQLAVLFVALGISEKSFTLTSANVPTASATASARPEWQARLIERLTKEVHTAFGREQWQQVLSRSQALMELADEDSTAMTPQLWRERGLAALALGQPIEAATAFEQALVADPTDIPTLLSYAQAQDQAGKTSEAIRLLKKAQVYAPMDDSRMQRDLASGLFTLYLREEQWVEAVSSLDETLAFSTTEPLVTLLALRAELLEKAGRQQEALDQWRTLTARREAMPDWLLARARLAHSIAHDAAEVQASLDAAEQLSPSNPAVIQARHELLLLPITAARFPQRLANLGFTGFTIGLKGNPVEYILPPLCEIPAGRFLMGSDLKRDTMVAKASWAKDEQPQHTVLLSAFAIARYPVTVAEYACFVRVGWPEPKEWTTQSEALDHPVVYVSWQDVVAYAAWLKDCTGQPWRLPTEAEWEKAARGTDGRIYPWGDTFDKTRCNSAEGTPSGTTPVGQYPNGASPYGVEEMAGNVCEWTSSLYREYPYEATDGREDAVAEASDNRVLRGGSWNGLAVAKRSAFRLQHPPSGNNNCGFRLAQDIE